jgi:hypothetical protein
MVRFFSIFFTLRESRRASYPALPGLAVTNFGGTLGALALKPSGFCNTGVKVFRKNPYKNEPVVPWTAALPYGRIHLKERIREETTNGTT